MRDTIKSKEYFDEYILKMSEGIKRFEEGIAAGKYLNDKILFVKDYILQKKIGIIIAKYSKGDSIEEIKKEFENYRLYQILYTISAVAIVFTGLIIFIVPIILFVLNAIMCGKIAKKLNVLTQKGVDQQSEWKGLKKYMEDFSLLKERGAVYNVHGFLFSFSKFVIIPVAPSSR